MFKLILFSAFSLFLMSNTASAVSTFVDFSIDGDVKAGTYTFGDRLVIKSWNPTSAVTQSAYGLGVENEFLDSPNEALTLNFFKEVFNLKLTFANWDADSDALYIRTGSVEVARCVDDCAQKTPQVDENGELQFLLGVTTLFINIFNDDDETSIALKSATWDDVTPSVVPLPAALPLYAAGMGLLGLVGWRKKRKKR